jgi:excisionase family DNA binding protein
VSGGRLAARVILYRRGKAPKRVKVMIWAEQMEKAKAVLTIGEVAEMLRVHPTTVYRLLKRGDIPGFKIGGNWRVSVIALDRWMSEMGLLPR